MIEWHRIDPQTGNPILIGMSETLEYQRRVQEENCRREREPKITNKAATQSVEVEKPKKLKEDLWILF